MDGYIQASDRLTEREQEILVRLSGGLSDQQIADELVLSLNTVKWYNRQIYSKLGVSSRTQAIAQASVLGLLASEPPQEHRRVGQRVHFTNSFDGTRLAFGIAGEGPPLVKVATYMGHLEYDWDSPVWHPLLEELTREHTLIRFDKRGCGLSDWNITDTSFEAWVRDLEAVVDTVGLTRFPLFAMSCAGAIAIAYTVRHPEKVSCLVLLGAYARGWLNRELTEAQIEEEQLMISLMRVGWGRENPAFRQVFATQLFPDATLEQLRALEEQMRISASPENAVRLEREMHQIDIRQIATQIQVPTLVLHARGDAAVPFEEGRLLASLIPNAQFVALESKNHLLTGHEPAWTKFVSVFRSFLNSHGG